MLKNISLSDQKILIGLAKRSIDYGFSNPQGRLPINLNSYSEPLRQKKACFVTLEKNKQLRGCIGTLMARSPLAQEVVDSAFSTAFLDQRFFKVTPNEFPELTIHISVLTTPEIINFTSGTASLYGISS